MAVEITQGESWPVEIDILLNGQALTGADVADVEVSIGEFLTKSCSEGGVEFNEELGCWQMTPTQKETMSLPEGYHKVQIRVKYKNDPAHLHTRPAGMIRVIRGFSREEI